MRRNHDVDMRAFFAFRRATSGELVHTTSRFAARGFHLVVLLNHLLKESAILFRILMLGAAATLKVPYKLVGTLLTGVDFLQMFMRMRHGYFFLP
jgi:hypothetical protein